MKRIFAILALILTVGIGSAFASNDNGGDKLPDFNLNKDVVHLAQVPTCGSDSSPTSANPANGWEYQGIDCALSTCNAVYTRTCEQTITIYWPWGAETYTWQTTESKGVTIND